ncbi:MAG: OFA family MFS transporter [Candidatus Methanoplasma sp.]|jgi:OFA family oxalate/formate antiporter-like MFS transporter|nr:OFA family MFS transporter [Candidatus Methanoplasma sp.]
MDDNSNVGINKKRYIVLIAGIAIQFCAGTLYMWSIYNTPVANLLFDGDKSASALTATFMLVAFVAGILIGGRIMDRIGPKKMAIIGSLIMSSGILASSLVNSDCSYLIYLTYGIIGGFGVGTVYTCTVSPIQKWFFDRRGFATGLMVGAFGFSLVIFGPLADRVLLPSLGVSSTFLVFGLAFLIVCVPASLFIGNPPDGYVIPKAPSANAQRQYTTKEMLRTRSFYFITLSLFFILSAFFVLNPLFKDLGTARGLGDLAVATVMIVGVCSASGRIAITWISDNIGRMSGLLLIFVLTIVGVTLVIFAEDLLFVVCMGLIAFGFGGAAGIYATVTSDNFGTKNMGSNYGLVMLGFGASALVAQVLSKTLVSDGDYTMVFVACAITCIASLVCILMLRMFSDTKNSTETKT